MHLLTVFALFLMLAASGISPAQAKPPHPSAQKKSGLPAEVVQALRRAQVPVQDVSVVVAPLPEASRPKALPARLSHRADARMNPASVMKLITTYAGLSLLGPDFTWRNRVYVDGVVHNGVLQGNLILRGSGDPKLVLERVKDLMAQIQAQGVRDVRGDIVLDRSVFDIQPRAPGSFDDEALRPYNAAPDGLLVNFKSLIYTFTPDESAGVARIAAEPPMAGFTVTPSVPLNAGPCSDWRSGLRGQFGSASQVHFAGSYPRSCGEKKWPVAYAVPEQFASRVIQAMWLGSGGSLSGSVREGPTPARARLLVEAVSLPLSDIIADINKFSNNVMAQQLFLSLSTPGRFDTSQARVLSWWRTTLPGQAEPVLENGSGLSREERSSAAALTRLLQVAAAGPHALVFQNSMGLAGVDGTVARLKDRSPNATAIGQAWLKTGSLRDVAALAGYVQGTSGQRYSLVVIVNHANANAARPALDTLLEWAVNDGAPRATSNNYRQGP